MGLIDSRLDDDLVENVIKAVQVHATGAEHNAALLVILISKASTRLAAIRGSVETAGLLDAVSSTIKSVPMPPPKTH
jgi:Arc/MetJ family transcription regulator